MVRALIVFIFAVSFFAESKALTSMDSTYVINTDSSVVEPVQMYVPKVPVLNESNGFIINKWEITEYKENGKIQELPNYEIEFFPDGTYSAIEEEEFDNGVWSLGENNGKLIFDENSINREEWSIVSMDAKKIVVKFTDEGKTYEYTFIPWVKRKQ